MSNSLRELVCPFQATVVIARVQSSGQNRCGQPSPCLCFHNLNPLCLIDERRNKSLAPEDTEDESTKFPGGHDLVPNTTLRASDLCNLGSTSRTRENRRFPIYGMTRKGTLLLRMPLGVCTVMNPLVAPAGTIARITLPDTTVNLAGVPFRKTPVVPVRPCPKMPSVCPALPESHTNLTKGSIPSEKRKTVPELPGPPLLVVP